jgi:hypothetical protein
MLTAPAPSLGANFTTLWENAVRVYFAGKLTHPRLLIPIDPGNEFVII